MLVTHWGEILTTGKSHKKKADGLFPREDSEMEKVLRFKYATRNVKGLGEKQEELDKTLQENINTSVIAESEKKL